MRTSKGIVILGGSEEIMNDLSIKMASRLMPNLWFKLFIMIINNINKLYFSY